MSGQITLGGHTYDNVSGGKFDEIKAILERPEEKPKLKFGDFGTSMGGTLCVKCRNGRIFVLPADIDNYFGDDERTLGVEYLGNLLEIIEAMKDVENNRGWTHVFPVCGCEQGIRAVGCEHKKGVPADSINLFVGGTCFNITRKDFFRFCSQGFAIAREL
jgi:hypothetical protein